MTASPLINDGNAGEILHNRVDLDELEPPASSLPGGT